VTKGFSADGLKALSETLTGYAERGEVSGLVGMILPARGTGPGGHGRVAGPRGAAADAARHPVPPGIDD
jgi:hypothetical protein